MYICNQSSQKSLTWPIKINHFEEDKYGTKNLEFYADFKFRDRFKTMLLNKGKTYLYSSFFSLFAPFSRPLSNNFFPDIFKNPYQRIWKQYTICVIWYPPTFTFQKRIFVSYSHCLRTFYANARKRGIFMLLQKVKKNNFLPIFIILHVCPSEFLIKYKIEAPKECTKRISKGIQLFCNIHICPAR